MKRKIKRVGIFILVLIVITSVIFFIFRTRIISHVVPAVEQIGIINIKVQNDTSYITSRLTVRNKSFLVIKIDTIKYKVSLLNKTYLQNQKFIGVQLQSHEIDTIDFSLKVPYVAIFKDLKVQKQKGDSTSFSINISLQYVTPFGKVEVPINKSAKFKIPQPPELKIVDIKYKKFRFKSILADVIIEIKNNSDVALSIKDINYLISIAKQGRLKGTHKETITIKPKGTTYINLPLEINLKNIGRTFFKTIFHKNNYDYTLTLDANLESINPVKKSFHVTITKNGKMKLIK